MKKEFCEALIKVFLIFNLIVIPLNLIQGLFAERIHELIYPFFPDFLYSPCVLSPDPLYRMTRDAQMLFVRLRFLTVDSLKIGAVLGSLLGVTVTLVRKMKTSAIALVGLFGGIGLSTTVVLFQERFQLLALMGGNLGYLEMFLPVIGFVYLYPLAVLLVLFIAFYQVSSPSIRRGLVQYQWLGYFWHRNA